MANLGIGIIGCGNISTSYLRLAPLFKGLEVRAVGDTFLGGTHQQARALIDEGRLGTITTGNAAIQGHGPESWHPNPEFFYLPGAGPIMDMGPYYIANLINLLGPVRRVGALTSSASPTRTIGSGDRAGQEIPVKTPSNIQALLEFHSGATIAFSASWDVWSHKRNHFELYGTEGSLYVPDPNFFGGPLEIAGRDGVIEKIEPWDHPFGIINQKGHRGEDLANYRTAGMADMVLAVTEGRDARCSLERTLHGVDVMTAALKSGETGQFITLTTTCTRPAALGPDQARALLR
jgi:predicted dehydrogenase